MEQQMGQASWVRGVLRSLAVAMLLSSAPALAHAILVESTPAINGTIAGPSVALVFRYNSRIDKSRSKLSLILPDKTQSTLPISQDGGDDKLETTTTLAPGTYTIRWQVLAIDGHITRGDVPFTVTAP
jgi:methionine-rich copper-binding protein CopC